MASVEWSEPAFEDLQEIHSYISRDSKKYADLTVISLREATARLSQFPRLGRKVPEFPHGPYRELIEGAYRVVYRIASEDRVLVIAIVHASRHIRRVLKSR